jgi:hypothetical protein
VAAAEVVDTAGAVSIAARVSELSLHGCCIDLIDPLREKTSILVKIDSGGRHLEASRTVATLLPTSELESPFMKLASIPRLF